MKKGHYHRYRIEVTKSPNIVDHPHPFRVKINRFELAKLLIRELIHYKGNLKVVSSRPCMYGVFSGPIGGFAPRERLCVGCLRCTTQYPKIATILPNQERLKLGDSYFTPNLVDTVLFEAEMGRIPIRGAGFRGKFGGSQWDGIWTDMSEIVRPTRDGIHGREFISTQVDLGGKPKQLHFKEGKPVGEGPKALSIPLPILFDALPDSCLDEKIVCEALLNAAAAIGTFSILPYKFLVKHDLKHNHLIPHLRPEELGEFKKHRLSPAFIEMNSFDTQFYEDLKKSFPDTLLILRTSFEDEKLMDYYQVGLRIFHLTANYHGRSDNGSFILESIEKVQKCFIGAKCRDQVSLIGSGGIIAAEHMAKAILLGLDAVALDTPLLVAMQAGFGSSTEEPGKAEFYLPKEITGPWATQRIKNLAAAWRDQLLEILSAMGLREVRRMRGERGRIMFQNELEKEAFQGIEGFDE